jgi:endonuclease YncB( thermonuclease family)
MRWLLILLSLSAATVLRCEPINPNEIGVVDGDTIDARGSRYRMLGYDTPEIRSRWRRVSPEEKALGERATARLKELLRSGPLDLTEKPCSCPTDAVGTSKCNYSRKCGLLTLDGQNVGDRLIKEGLAVPFICNPTRCPRMPKWDKIIRQRGQLMRAIPTPE